MSYGIIIVPASEDAPLRWAVGDEGTLAGGGQVATAADLPEELLGQDDITLLLPGEHAATRRMRLPVRGERALTDAAALAFEDVLSDGVEGYHFAFGPLDADGTRMVSAMPTSVFSAHLNEFTDAGIEPDRVTLDHLALRVAGQDAIALFLDDRVIARLPDGGVSGDAHFLAPIVVQLAGAAKVMIVDGDRHGSDGQSADLTLADDRALGAFYLSGLGASEAPNFRRGPFAKQRDWMSLASGWRQAGYLMAACFTLWIADSAIDGVKHARAADRLYDDASAAFTQAFPGTPIRDLRRQAQQRQAVNGGSAFLPLSSALTEGLDGSVALRLTGLRYTDEGMLVADLRFPDAAALESLKAKLQDLGVRTREGGNLRREDNGDFAGQLFLEASL